MPRQPASEANRTPLDRMNHRRWRVFPSTNLRWVREEYSNHDRTTLRAYLLTVTMQNTGLDDSTRTNVEKESKIPSVWARRPRPNNNDSAHRQDSMVDAIVDILGRGRRGADLDYLVKGNTRGSLTNRIPIPTMRRFQSRMSSSTIQRGRFSGIPELTTTPGTLIGPNRHSTQRTPKTTASTMTWKRPDTRSTRSTPSFRATCTPTMLAGRSASTGRTLRPSVTRRAKTGGKR